MNAISTSSEYYLGNVLVTAVVNDIFVIFVIYVFVYAYEIFGLKTWWVCAKLIRPLQKRQSVRLNLKKNNNLSVR